MTISNVKGMVAKAMMAGLAAGTLMVAAPKAQAQGFAVGVQFGAPYYGDRYDGRERFEFERRQEFLRQQEFARREAILRHEQWEREQRFDQPYARRDERFFDRRDDRFDRRDDRRDGDR